MGGEIVSKYKNNELLLFVVSVILASFAYNLYILNNNSYSINDLLIKLSDIGKNNKFGSIAPYVLLKRVKQAIIIFLLFKTFNPETIIDLLIIAFGVFTGMMITGQVYLNGIYGMFVYVLSLLPHYPVYIYLIKNLYNLNNLSSHDKEFWGYFLFSISILGIGVVCESYFSIFFLKEFYQHIVMHLM